jgi:hypothetical protein
MVVTEAVGPVRVARIVTSSFTAKGGTVAIPPGFAAAGMTYVWLYPSSLRAVTEESEMAVILPVWETIVVNPPVPSATTNSPCTSAESGPASLAAVSWPWSWPEPPAQWP